MTHLHKASGLTFEVGKLMDTTGKEALLDDSNPNATYDLIIITYWTASEEPVVLVDYYFGDYDEETTDCFIDRWLSRQPWYHS